MLTLFKPAFFWLQFNLSRSMTFDCHMWELNLMRSKVANVGRIIFTLCPSSLERCHSTLKIQMMFQKDSCCRLLPECFLSRLNHNLVRPKYLIKIQLLKKDIKETL